MDTLISWPCCSIFRAWCPVPCVHGVLGVAILPAKACLGAQPYTHHRVLKLQLHVLEVARDSERERERQSWLKGDL